MSRFWAAGGASDDSESSDDESSDYSSDDSAGGLKTKGKWEALSDEESSSEDEVRVVKSAKERALETFARHIKALREAMKVKDYYKL